MMANLPYALPILRPLQAAIRARGGEAAWFFHGSGAQFLGDDEVLLRDPDAVLRFKPDAVFVPGNWVPHFFPGVKVRVGHGFVVPGKENNYSIRGHFDIYCTYGRYDTPEFTRLSQELGHFTAVETGWPKLDPLFDPAVAPLEVKGDRPIVLYASTFTQRLTSAEILVDEVRRMASSGRWRWLVTLHPKLPSEVVQRWRDLESEHLRFVETKDVIPFLKAGDVMVCDTSSILMEFLTQVRPVVTFRNGGDANAPHLLNVTEPGQLEGAIDRALSRPADLMSHVQRYAEGLHTNRDGHSSERVLDAVEEFIRGNIRPPRRKPFNAWRKLQMRWRLNYWR